MTPRTETSAVHLWLLLWKATRALEVHARRSVTALGMCLSDFGVLEALLHKGPLPVNALGRKVLLTSGSMTAAVDRLERRGLVERRAGGGDRRARIVQLTEQGRRLIRKLFAAHGRDMKRAIAGIERREIEALARGLRRLGHAVEEQRR